MITQLSCYSNRLTLCILANLGLLLLLTQDTRSDGEPRLLQFPLSSSVGPPLVLATATTPKVKLNQSQHKAIEFLNMNGFPGQGYYLTLYIGTPAQAVKLLIDTGSANLAVASRELPGVSEWFNASLSSTLNYLNDRIHLNYQQGSWTGHVATDFLDLINLARSALDTDERPPRLSVQMALIDNAVEFFLGTANKPNWNGIIGLAFSNIAVQPRGLRGISYTWLKYLLSMDQNVPPPIQPKPYLMPSTHSIMVDIAEQYGLADKFSVLLCGSARNMATTSRNSNSMQQDGTFVLGGTHANLKADNQPFYYTPIRYAWYYEVVLTDFRVADVQVIDDCKELNFDKTIVDTGTTNIRLPHRVFDSFLKLVLAYVQKQDPQSASVIGPKFWSSKSVLCQTPATPLGGPEGSPYWLFPTLTFEMVLATGEMHSKVLQLNLSPEQYIRYIGQVDSEGQTKDCFVFGVQRDSYGTILGAVFVEGFYTEFDREGMKIGFANSACSPYSKSARVQHSSVNGEVEWKALNKLEWATDYPHVPKMVYPRDCAFYRPDFDPFRRRFMGMSLWHMTFIVLTMLIFLLFFALVGLFIRFAVHWLLI